MTPPVAATFWSFRVMLISSALLMLIALWLVSTGRRHSFDLTPLSGYGLRVLGGVSSLSLLLSVASLAWIFLGTLPYAIGGTVTYSEVLSDISLTEVAIGLLLHAACLATLTAGFVLLVRHAIRHGVIPVKRNRRLA